MGTTIGIECPAGHRRALALPAAVPARQLAHVRPDGEWPNPLVARLAAEGGRAAAAGHP